VWGVKRLKYWRKLDIRVLGGGFKASDLVLWRRTYQVHIRLNLDFLI